MFTTDRREDLQDLLETLLGTENVYFQPPSNLKMQYPAIVYQRDQADTMFANNSPYRRTMMYQVTVIDQDPDSKIPEKVSALPMCYHSAFFAADQLNHDVFRLYF